MPEREGQKEAARRKAPATGRADAEAATEFGRAGRTEQVTGRAGYRPEQFGADVEYGTVGEAGPATFGAYGEAAGRGAVTAETGEAVYQGYTGDVARTGARVTEATTGLRAEATPGTFAGAGEGYARGTAAATGWGGVTGAADLEAGAEYETSLMEYEGRTNAAALRTNRRDTEVAAEPGTGRAGKAQRKEQKERR